jgi:hypothetical protein
MKIIFSWWSARPTHEVALLKQAIKLGFVENELAIYLPSGGVGLAGGERSLGMVTAAEAMRC